MSKVSPASPTDPKSVDPDNKAAWEEAKADAEDAGIRWERPKDDTRSAKEILEDSKLLSNLGNQSGVRDALEARVGGKIGEDADATYRAVQVLEHVETFDAGGDLTLHDSDGKINGFTSSGDAKGKTEAGRLQDFGKYGFGNLNGELRHIDTAANDSEARDKAEDLGIEWNLPDGDDRSAKDIIEGNPILGDLGNQSDVRDMLKEQVGDFEKDADAAYRALQVLEHVERYNDKGERIAGKAIDDGKINGFNKSGDAKDGTEADRLVSFGQNGFDALKGEIRDVDEAGGDKDARAMAEDLGIIWVRPEGDDRSAKDIIEEDSLLRNLGNQSGLRDMLKEQVGDFEKDADAAFRASQVLKHVETYDDSGDAIKGGSVGDGKINGVTKDGEAKEGTEAGRLQDFGKYGFEVLKGKLDDSVLNEIEERGDQESLDAINEVREDAGLPALTDVTTLETSEKGADGEKLTVTEAAWSQVMKDWKKGIDDGSIKPDDDRAKMYNALQAGTFLGNGGELYAPSLDGSKTETVSGSDFENVINGDKVDETIAALMESEVVSKDVEAARKAALEKVEGGDRIVEDLKKTAMSTEYAEYIQDLSNDPDTKKIAQDDINTTYTSLLAVDPAAAETFAQNMQINSLTMELDALMADPSKIDQENLTLAGSDIGKIILTFLKKGAIDLGRNTASAIKTIESLLSDKAGAEDFGKAMQELGATFSKTGEITDDDVKKALGNGKFEGFSDKSILGIFDGLNQTGVLYSAAGIISLASGIYQLAGKGGSLSDTPEERLAVAKDFMSFIGAGKGFADLGNHIIGEHNLDIKAHNERIDRLYRNNPTEVDIDKLKKQPVNQIMGLGGNLNDLLGAPSTPDVGPHKDRVEFFEQFIDVLDESSSSEKYRSIIPDISNADYDRIIKGIEDGYQTRPDLINADGKPLSAGLKGAAAALLIIDAGATTFTGAADIALGALSIEKGEAKGDDALISKGALQVAAGGFGIVAGVSSGLGLLKGLQFAKAVTGPSFFVSSLLTVAALIPDLILSTRNAEKLKEYQGDLRDFFTRLDEEGMLVEGGLDNYRFLDAYMEEYGQRDAPDGVSIFDYRSDEAEHFRKYWDGDDSKGVRDDGDFTSDEGLNVDRHNDYMGDNANLPTELEMEGGVRPN